jgi:peptidyl-prolyl cis-trans isomerase SurA
MRIRTWAGIAGLAACASVYAQTQHQILDRIVAVVEREIITETEVNAQLEFFVFNNRVDPATPNLRRQVLESMINEKLILAKAVEESVVVSDDEVTQQLDALIQQRALQAGGERRLEELYGMSIGKMKREFRDDMRKQLLVSRLQQTKFGTIQVSRREVEEFFTTYKDSLPTVPEEVELYHIFRLPKASTEAKALVTAKAEKILDSLKRGGDFADFARRYSEDPGSAATGGDLGFIRRGQLVKEFEEVVFRLRENELSKVVESSFGLHIIQLLERRGESVRARHILFKIPQDESAEQNTIAFLAALRDSALQGESFTGLAKRHSEDAETAPLGGYLGTFPVDQLEQSLAATVKTLKAGDISEPVSVKFGTRTGFHIVYVKNRIPEHRMNLTDDWKRIESIAANMKRNAEYQKWIEELKKDIYWEIRL